jgi:hypothetical protein
MSKIIDPNDTLQMAYNKTCILFRAITLEESKGVSVCQWCKRKKSEHLSDGRCDSYVTTHCFRSMRCEELVKVERVLAILEELIEL